LFSRRSSKAASFAAIPGGVGSGGYEELEMSVPRKSRQRDSYSTQHKILFAVALILFIMLIVLQFIGLHYSFGPRPATFTESWASPAFQLGPQVLTLPGCSDNYTSTPSPLGYGTINIPGNQAFFLRLAQFLCIISLVLEFFDSLLLLGVRHGKSWGKMKLKRPWTTMIFGLCIQIMIVGLGLWQEQFHWPLSSHEAAIVGGGGPNGTCMTTLGRAGIRGGIIGWSDGVFEGGLGALYCGVSC
jgi:hypothetical protein